MEIKIKLSTTQADAVYRWNETRKRKAETALVRVQDHATIIAAEAVKGPAKLIQALRGTHDIVYYAAYLEVNRLIDQTWSGVQSSHGDDKVKAAEQFYAGIVISTLHQSPWQTSSSETSNQIDRAVARVWTETARDLVELVSYTDREFGK